jgi:BirA family biotin operon repressor/biotin-[acetyl-CoA-carboxylase] ligase
VNSHFGEPREHHAQIGSTNARAKELAAEGAPGGLVVTADEQTAGRGRQGREWFAPPGGALLYSALLRPLGDRPLLPLAVPLAVCDAAEALAPVECGVKWPNDVWIADRKLAGVLIEGRPEEDWAVIGIGLNVDVPDEAFPEELRETAVSLSAAGASATVAEARDALNGSLGDWVDAEPRLILEEFRRRDALRGRRISWSDGAGVADGIDDSGHLLVRSDDGEELKLGAGEVHLEVGGWA